VTAAFEKFMTCVVEFGLVFPSAAKTENVEAEARVMLAWLKEGRYWVNLSGGEETSTRGRLLQLLPNVESADLRLDIEETLKKKPYREATSLLSLSTDSVTIFVSGSPKVLYNNYNKNNKPYV